MTQCNNNIETALFIKSTLHPRESIQCGAQEIRTLASKTENGTLHVHMQMNYYTHVQIYIQLR